MPSRPLSADRKVLGTLNTRLDNEAISVVKERTTLPAAVARVGGTPGVPTGRPEVPKRGRLRESVP